MPLGLSSVFSQFFCVFSWISPNRTKKEGAKPADPARGALPEKRNRRGLFCIIMIPELAPKETFLSVDCVLNISVLSIVIPHSE